MVNQNPIFIAAPPRSGTTLLAAILNAHGVWVGRGRITQYPGTNMDFASENQDIKSIMKHTAGMMGYSNWDTPLPSATAFEGDELKKEIEVYVPSDTPWLVKTSWTLTFWKFWHEAYPDAKWLFPIRDIDKIVDSMNRHPGMKRHPDVEKFDYVMALQRRRFEAITAEVNNKIFNIEYFVDKENDIVRGVFDFLEIDPDWDIINEILVPKMLAR